MKELVERARKGDLRALARAVTFLEEDPGRLPAMLKGRPQWPLPRLTAAVTGPPGVGKSSFLSRVLEARRARNPEERIAVLAVDPSSHLSGGAVLGDRIRMMEHSGDPRLFIRSFAARGRLGGLAPSIRAVLFLLGTLGWDLVLLETVGVGQSEVEAASTADLTAVLLAPGQGDQIQMLKAGLLEAADLFVVHKADLPGAERVAADLEAALDLAGESREGRPPVLLASSREGRGAEEFLDALEERALVRRDALDRKREEARASLAREALLEEAGRRLRRALERGEAPVRAVLEGRRSVDAAAEDLLRAALEERNRGERR